MKRAWWPLAFLTACAATDDRPADWDFISPVIFQPNCASGSCHNPAAAVSGLDFSTPERGYASLTRLWVDTVQGPAGDGGAAPGCDVVAGQNVCVSRERPLVTAFDPEGSRVVNMLRARGAPRMPPDRPLTEADIRLVERWILNGACVSGLSCLSTPDAGREASSAPGDGGHEAGASDGASDARAVDGAP